MESSTRTTRKNDADFIVNGVNEEYDNADYDPKQDINFDMTFKKDEGNKKDQRSEGRKQEKKGDEYMDEDDFEDEYEDDDLESEDQDLTDESEYSLNEEPREKFQRTTTKPARKRRGSSQKGSEGRARGGRIGAAAKVGFQDPNEAMEKAKTKVIDLSAERSGSEKGNVLLKSDSLVRPASEVSSDKNSHEPSKKQDRLNLADIHYSTDKTRKRRYSEIQPAEESAVSRSSNTRKKAQLMKLVSETEADTCDNCKKQVPPDDTRGSHRILPVTRKKDISLCKDCRVDYYLDNPEPFPMEKLPRIIEGKMIIPRLTKGEATHEYVLSGQDVMTLPYETGRNPYFSNRPSMYLFIEQDVIRLARQVHGGDIGIVAAIHDSENSGRKFREPKTELPTHRRNLLRSLLHEAGLTLPEHSAVCQIYIEDGRGDPYQIVRILQELDWLHRCAKFYPSGKIMISTDIRHLKPQSQQILHQEELSPEEMKELQTKLIKLSEWMDNRIKCGIYRHYKYDPDSLDKPPESLWPLLDKINFKNKLKRVAINRMMRELIRKCNENDSNVESMDLEERQCIEMVDKSDEKNNDESNRLSSVLKRELGPDWYKQVLSEAKARAAKKIKK